MKTLLVLRHAKSSHDDPGLDDHERSLNDRGRRDAPRMGRLLADEDLVPDLILSSTAVRARTTAEAAAKASGYQQKIELDRSLYLASPEEYIEALRELPETRRRVLVVGHNPGMEQLVEVLTGQSETLPTAALACITLPIDRWRDLRSSTTGTLDGLWRPKEIE
jgi:phosphohistidine phosphatase